MKNVIFFPAFQSLAEAILANHGLARPGNLAEALKVHFTLVQTIESSVDEQ